MANVLAQNILYVTNEYGNFTYIVISFSLKTFKETFFFVFLFISERQGWGRGR